MEKPAYLLSILLVLSIVPPHNKEFEVANASAPIVTPAAILAEEAVPKLAGSSVPIQLTADVSQADVAEKGQTTSTDLVDHIPRLAAISPPPELSNRELGYHTVPCLPGTSLSLNDVEGESYTCGIFTVPQNWVEPDGRNLDLGVLIAKATGEEPQPDPLLILTGGPGQSSILAPVVEKYRKLRSERDIILFDIRGSGVSQRLGFEECLVLALRNGAPVEKIQALETAATRLLAVARGEQPPYSPDLWELNLPLLNETCWEQFSTQGIDPKQFTTAANAIDAVELVKALGYNAFNLAGASYGTRLAMTIMNKLAAGYDDAPRLRATVLDSAYPPSVYLIRTIVRSDHDFILQLLEECQVDTACNAAYPNLKERLAALFDRLDDNPLTVDGELVTVEDVVNQLKNLGGTRAGYLPRMIAELGAGRLNTYLALRDGLLGANLPESFTGLDLDPSDPVQAFIMNASALLNDQATAEFGFYANIALIQEDPLAQLQTIIQQGYPGVTGVKMLEMLTTLTTEDIAASPYVAKLLATVASTEDNPEVQLAKLRRGVAAGIPHFLYSSVHCADDILHERFEDAVNSYNDLQFPQMTDLNMSRAQAERCKKWSVPAAPIEVKDPVVSNVPTIILQGAYDPITPIYMGRRADRELENSTYVLVPQQGHGTWNDAKGCVGQITTAFVQNPNSAIDPGCLKVRKPRWVLPHDNLQ